MIDPYLVPGGGAGEMEIAKLLEEKAKSVTGVHQWPFRALARSFEVIPRTLIQNCGANIIRTLTALRAKHAQEGNSTWGVDGNSGEIVDMKQLGIWEPLSVKLQTYKTAIEVLKESFLFAYNNEIQNFFIRFFRQLFYFLE